MCYCSRLFCSNKSTGGVVVVVSGHLHLPVGQVAGWGRGGKAAVTIALKKKTNPARHCIQKQSTLRSVFKKKCGFSPTVSSENVWKRSQDLKRLDCSSNKVNGKIVKMYYRNVSVYNRNKLVQIHPCEAIHPKTHKHTINTIQIDSVTVTFTRTGRNCFGFQKDLCDWWRIGAIHSLIGG